MAVEPRLFARTPRAGHHNSVDLIPDGATLPPEFDRYVRLVAGGQPRGDDYLGVSRKVVQAGGREMDEVVILHGLNTSGLGPPQLLAVQMVLDQALAGVGQLVTREIDWKAHGPAPVARPELNEWLAAAKKAAGGRLPNASTGSPSWLIRTLIAAVIAAVIAGGVYVSMFAAAPPPRVGGDPPPKGDGGKKDDPLTMSPSAEREMWSDLDDKLGNLPKDGAKRGVAAALERRKPGAKASHADLVRMGRSIKDRVGAKDKTVFFLDGLTAEDEGALSAFLKDHCGQKAGDPVTLRAAEDARKKLNEAAGLVRPVAEAVTGLYDGGWKAKAGPTDEDDTPKYKRVMDILRALEGVRAAPETEQAAPLFDEHDAGTARTVTALSVPVLGLVPFDADEKAIGERLADRFAVFAKSNPGRKAELARVEKALVPLAVWLVKNRPKGK